MPNNETTTKQLILDAAERLFTEQGIDATSIRAITTAAHVNLAAINYHFGSKDGLVEAVVKRQFEPVVADRARRFAELDRGADAPSLRELLHAFLRPAFLLDSDAQRGMRRARLLGRLQGESNPAHRQSIRAHFEEQARRYFPLIRTACPHLDEATFTWRIHFTLGALGHTLADFFDLYEHSDRRCDPRDAESATWQIVEFAVAGLQAKPGPKASPRRGTAKAGSTR